MFACITHRQHIIANIIGILYSAQLYVFSLYSAIPPTVLTRIQLVAHKYCYVVHV